MDPTKLLEADHRTAEDLFDQIEKAEGDARTPLVQELVTALRGHMELEETTVYPQMAPVTGEEAVEEGNKEHELARKAMQDVVDLAPDDPGFGAALEALKAGIMHHVEEEEGDIFKQLRQNGDILEQIATPFMQKRVELGLPMDAEALATASTKNELAAEAASAGIDVTSSMTKSDIAEALVEHMAGSSS